MNNKWLNSNSILQYYLVVIILIYMIQLISENLHLRSKLTEIRSKPGVPSMEYEIRRRRLKRTVSSFWRYLNFQLSERKKVSQLAEVIDFIYDVKLSLINDIDALTENDGYEQWRHAEVAELSEIMQKKLDQMQNPGDCLKRPKIYCTDMGQWCGIGCQREHLNDCFRISYANNRTLIYDPQTLTYIQNFYGIYEQFSQTCTVIQANESREAFAGYLTPNYVINLPSTIFLMNWPQKNSIPADLAPRLLKLFDDPFAWWMGQFQEFYVKPQPKIQKMVDDVIEGYNLALPYACVHVRRSEKIQEAAYIPLTKYMTFVKEYFDQLDVKSPNTPRKVFLAADDPQVFVEARDKFTEYQFITNDKAATMVHKMENRKGLNYMALTIADFEVLSKCGLTLVTHSSNYGRRIHEMKYNYYRDASERTISLDTPYFVYVQDKLEYKVVFRHVSKNPRKSLEVGDKVLHETIQTIRDSRNWNNLFNGHTKVHFGNLQLEVPDYKLELVVHPIDMPSYDDTQKEFRVNKTENARPQDFFSIIRKNLVSHPYFLWIINKFY